MYLGNHGHTGFLPGRVKNQLFVTQRNPYALKADQDRSALRVSDNAYYALAFGCFDPWVYL
jgi:hypothetical protein